MADLIKFYLKVIKEFIRLKFEEATDKYLWRSIKEVCITIIAAVIVVSVVVFIGYNIAFYTGLLINLLEHKPIAGFYLFSNSLIVKDQVISGIGFWIFGGIVCIIIHYVLIKPVIKFCKFIHNNWKQAKENVLENGE